MQRLRRIKTPFQAKRLHREPPGVEEFKVNDLIVFRRRNRGYTVFARQSKRFEPNGPEFVLLTEEFEAVTEIAPIPATTVDPGRHRKPSSASGRYPQC